MAAHTHILEKARSFASEAIEGLEKEHELLQTLHHEVDAALARCKRDDHGLQSLLGDAHGYAVFPRIGKAAAVIGGAFGKGEVFEQGLLIGYAGLIQITLGLQFGGETFTQMVVFENKPALDRFRHGEFGFGASASATLVKAGAAASTRFDRGVAVLLHSDGGMMLELALTAQKFVYADAFMGRGKRANRRGS